MNIEDSFFDLCIDAGQQVLAAMMGQDRDDLCGPCWQRDPERRAGRAGRREPDQPSLRRQNQGARRCRSDEQPIKRAKLGSYDYLHLHFATHGILSGEIPGLEKPALVLAYEESENGFAGALRKGIDVHTLPGRAFLSRAGSQPSETHPAEVLETLLIPAGAANASPTASP